MTAAADAAKLLAEYREAFDETIRLQDLERIVAAQKVALTAKCHALEADPKMLRHKVTARTPGGTITGTVCDYGVAHLLGLPPYAERLVKPRYEMLRLFKIEYMSTTNPTGSMRVDTHNYVLAGDMQDDTERFRPVYTAAMETFQPHVAVKWKPACCGADFVLFASAASYEKTIESVTAPVRRTLQGSCSVVTDMDMLCYFEFTVVYPGDEAAGALAIEAVHKLHESPEGSALPMEGSALPTRKRRARPRSDR